ncbi:hypothetical protein RJ639_045367 [Escallonia herrerae]|uniref:tRNA synthetases class I (E and Q) anti-codon binding domain-containing protein n=1 Tax=Escallonia herrerae TaxID=1293975 RepID=A0AA89B242_9ASTE|nr:hypothetical protein RJ639_045367 [Escallonia herrerae]
MAPPSSFRSTISFIMSLSTHKRIIFSRNHFESRCIPRASHIIPQLDEDEDFLGVLNPCTKKEITALGDSNMRNLKRGEILQLERKGYFICDAPFVRSSKPIVLFAIPDGRQQSGLK